MGGTSFTPGPWEAGPAGCAGQYLSPPEWAGQRIYGLTVRGPDAKGVCNLTCREGTRPEFDANAVLIAAAPDLYEALDPETLETIADEIDCFEHSARAAGLRGIAKRQRAALLKANPEAREPVKPEEKL